VVLRQTQQQSFIFGVVYRDEMSHSANLGAILRDGLPANTTFPSRSDYLVLLSYRLQEVIAIVAVTGFARNNGEIKTTYGK
jgi:hypothetical protein